MKNRKRFYGILAAFLVVANVLPCYGATTQEQIGETQQEKQQTEAELQTTEANCGYCTTAGPEAPNQT